MTDDPPPDFADAFPILGEMVFFNHAGVAPLSRPAAEALRRYADEAESRAYVGGNWYADIRGVKRLAARLINAAGEQEIALVANTSTGLNMVAGGLDWVPGDNVVITSVEFPANRYPWEQLKRRGVELIAVAPDPEGRVHAEDVADAVTNRTRVVAVSHVQYANGFHTDLRPIADMVHMAGGYLCVDAIQSLGALPVDVAALGVDFLAADGHKWLLGPEGCGIFYCSDELTQLLHPAVVGWMCVVDASSYGDYRLEFEQDARRFEPGSYNVAGALAMGASLDLLLRVGVDEVWSRIERLTGHLCAGLAERGYRIASPRDDGERSGIVSFEPPIDGPPPAQIVARLKREGIIIVEREGRLRASPHFYNTVEQVDRLLAALG